MSVIKPIFLLSIAFAGALGAWCRLLLGETVLFAAAEGHFPLTTFVCNLLGSFLLGWFVTLCAERLSQTLYSAISIGFLGAFTTFSALSIDLLRLLEEGHWIAVGAYGFGSLFGGLLFAWFGATLARRQKKVSVT